MKDGVAYLGSFVAVCLLDKRSTAPARVTEEWRNNAKLLKLIEVFHTFESLLLLCLGII